MIERAGCTGCPSSGSQETAKLRQPQTSNVKGSASVRGAGSGGNSALGSNTIGNSSGSVRWQANGLAQQVLGAKQQQQATLASPILTSTTLAQNVYPARFSYLSHQLDNSAFIPASPLHLLSSTSQRIGNQGLLSLSPDARACVTATYLCVLIVNNTWLDCNLLEALCSGNQAGSRVHATASNDASSSPESSSSESFGSSAPPIYESSLGLNVIESILNELVVFAGGGSQDGSLTDQEVNRNHVSGREASGWLMRSASDPNPSSYSQAIPSVSLPEDSGGGSRTGGLLGWLNNVQLAQPDETIIKEPRRQILKPKSSRSVPIRLTNASSNQEEVILRAPLSHQPTWPSASNEPNIISQLSSSMTQQTDTMRQAQQVQTMRPIDQDHQTGSELMSNYTSTRPALHRSAMNQFGATFQIKPVPQPELASSRPVDVQQPSISAIPTKPIVLGLATTNNNKENSSTSSSIGDGQDRKHQVLFALGQLQSQTYNEPSAEHPSVPGLTRIENHNLVSPFVNAGSLAALGPQQALGYENRNSASQPAMPDNQDGQFSLNQDCSRCGNEASESQLASVQMESCRARCNLATPTTLSGSDSQLVPVGLSSSASIGLQTAAGTSMNSNPVSSNSGSSMVTGAKMSPMDISFILYTRQQLANKDSPDNETILHESGVGFEKINGSLPVKMVIHGFASGGRKPWVRDMVEKLLSFEDANVIVVDWEKGATMPNYVQAAGNTRLVGHKIAALTRSINTKCGLTGDSYHLIGFSLGAHVAGFAGMELRNSSQGFLVSNRLNRITGLDPASPLFEGYEPNDRLDPSDAQFVDVIHSNGDGVLRGGFGSLQPMGHVDFYPNGGRVQLGCSSVLLSALSDIIYGKWQSLCNHRRALNFFMDSFEFNKCRFRSFSCDSYESFLRGDCFDCGQNQEKCSYMGYLANYSKGRGKMYLATHEDTPFCANQLTIRIVGTKGHRTHWGKVEVTLVTHDGKNESFWLSSANHQSSNSISSNLIGSSSGNGNNFHHHHHHEAPTGGPRDGGHHSMQSLVVAHPSLINFTQVLLRYTRYKGWIYSGDESWPIDKVLIMDSEGQSKSYCGYNTILESHIVIRLNLEPGNCSVVDSSSNSPPNSQSSRLLVGNSQSSNPHQIQVREQQSAQQQHQSQSLQNQPQVIGLRIPRLLTAQLAGELPVSVGLQFSQVLQRLVANLERQQQQQLGYPNLGSLPNFVEAV